MCSPNIAKVAGEDVIASATGNLIPQILESGLRISKLKSYPTAVSSSPSNTPSSEKLKAISAFSGILSPVSYLLKENKRHKFYIDLATKTFFTVVMKCSSG